MKCTECPEYTKCRSRYDLRIKRHRCLKAKDQKVYTNADRIRSMSDEELVDFLWQFDEASFESVMPFCKITVECDEKLDSTDISTEMCKQCLLDKLQQPCKDSVTVEKG